MGDFAALWQAPLRGAGFCLAGAVLGVGFFGREGRFGILAAYDLCWSENPGGRICDLARGRRLGWEPAFEARLAGLCAVGGVQRGLLFRVSDPGYSVFALWDGGGVGVLAADAGWATGLDDLGRVALFGQDRRPDTGFLGHYGGERGERPWKRIRGGRGVRCGFGFLLGTRDGLFQAVRGEGLDHVGGGDTVRDRGHGTDAFWLRQRRLVGGVPYGNALRESLLRVARRDSAGVVDLVRPDPGGGGEPRRGLRFLRAPRQHSDRGDLPRRTANSFAVDRGRPDRHQHLRGKPRTNRERQIRGLDLRHATSCELQPSFSSAAGTEIY